MKLNQYIIAGAVILLILPILLDSLGRAFYVNMIFLALMFGIAAMAWNLLMGYTGLFSLGHAVFFGVGGYTVMVLMIYYGVTPWIGLAIAGVVAGLLGVALSPMLLRLRSHWFTLATIALGEIFKLTFAHWDYVGGSSGLQMTISERRLYYIQFKGATVYSYLAMAVLALELVILWRIINSRTGYYLQTIREDELVAQTLGINTFKYKVIALAISGFFTGVAGGLYAVRFRYVDPFAVFDLITISTYISVAGIIGGIYTFLGPVVGSFIFIPISEYVRANIVQAIPRVYGLHVAVLGVILLLISLFAPEGVLGYLRKRGVLK
ncbi:MAG: branched-chain amino acid ABC transporter permease [Desulfurococcales archaeon]|nr:branched-chain amino acid ABC transporter permease [Desulfurococcales archaeon]